MRFLRMFTNSLLAGGLSAAYLTVLVLQLNPDLPLLSTTTVRWYLALAVTYGLHLAIGFYVLIVLREFFSVHALSPGWASVRVLAWLSAASAGLAAILMWLNVGVFRAALGEIAARRMVAGAAAAAVSALVLVGIAIVHYSYGWRGGRVGGALFAMAAFGSLTLPLAARGPAVPRGEPVRWAQDLQAAPDAVRVPRLVLLLLDGASLEYIRTRGTEGRLPNFSRVLEDGASMYLATLRPAEPATVWAAVATGMYPAKNGVRSAADHYAWGGGRPAALLPAFCLAQVLVRLGIVRDDPVTSTAWQARPLWSILSNAGIVSGVVRWPLTHPAPPVLGFMLTDRFDEPSRPASPFDEHAAYPARALASARASLNEPDALDGDAGDVPDAAARHDRLHSRVLRDLQAEYEPRFSAVRLQAIDAVAHRHFEESGPAPFRGNGEGDSLANAQLIGRVYEHADAEVGRALETLSPGDLLMVVSGFGMERLTRIEQLVARMSGDPQRRAGHDGAPDGFLLAYGAAVQSGRLPPGSIVDVTPTVLYFFGVPIGRDMDGYARTDLFTADFIAERPIAFIASHNP